MAEENVLTPPVKEGDTLESQEVISSGKKDSGVIKYDGYIIFVDGAVKGEIVNVKIEKVLPKFGIGRKI